MEERELISMEGRRLLIENIAEMKELKGELLAVNRVSAEFKEHVIGRLEKLERQEREYRRNRIALLSLLVSLSALIISLFAEFFK